MKTPRNSSSATSAAADADVDGWDSSAGPVPTALNRPVLKDSLDGLACQQFHLK